MKTKISQKVLGTVQLGMKYGLNNSSGQPSQGEAFSMLDIAFSAGIDTFDTAWSYGSAEDVLGAWIHERSLAGKVKIISKMKPHVINEYPDGTKASDVIRTEVVKSLKRLGVDFLEGYLFHSPYYVYLKHALEGLRLVKQERLVSYVGVSVYDEAEALQAVEFGVDYIQVPYNVFDQRLDSTDFFELAEKKNIKVFARSPFLQGALLMTPDRLPPHLTYLQPYLAQFISLAAKHSMTVVEASLNFVHAQHPSSAIVFGVDTAQQLAEDIAVMNNNSPVPEVFIKDITEAFKGLNRGAVNPSLWSKIKL